ITDLIYPVSGQALAKSSDKIQAGSGTYLRHGYIYSSLVGKVHLTKGPVTDTHVVEVFSGKELTVVPSPGDVVTVRISQVTQRYAKCQILCIRDVELSESFSGLLRKEDVQAEQKDKVEMYKSFRPGDIVLSKVVSIGDSQSYLLTTAEDELGVVIAYGEGGVPMVAIGWQEMQCPKTFQKENRKVAKVVSELFEFEESVDK
ncbi:exosome complex component CSL4-like, partial [Artemia franciscana]|uniref:exosome complex component CSL4-like n=1 Tax=Artemia franciscana TaxID=6661 RepID=UPI0032DA2A42